MKWKTYKTGDVLNFDSSNGIFHACNMKIENKKIIKIILMLFELRRTME